MIICPSCGSTFEGDLCVGCPSCGARAVGPPLAKAEHELRSYGRALGAAASGVLMSASFLGSVIFAWAQFKGLPFTLSAIVTAGEVAAWRLKWLVVPAAFVALWSGSRLIRSIKNSSSRFGGLRLARAGFVASAAVTVLIATLIGITIPERLRARQDAIEAAIFARGYALHRAFLEYRELHGTLPTENYIKELRTLPDPDGSIAEALRYVDANGYQASSVLAAASTKVKPLVARGSAFRNAPANSAIATDHGVVSFTIYELRLPSEHKLFSTDDDFIMRDGLITKASDPRPSSSAPTRP